jgi:hypothetical protein
LTLALKKLPKFSLSIQFVLTRGKIDGFFSDFFRIFFKIMFARLSQKNSKFFAVSGAFIVGSAMVCIIFLE